MEKKLNVGVVGCGAVALKGHVPALRSSRYLRLVAAADVSEKALKRFGRKTGVKRLYKDYRDMIEKEEIDVVDICTPPSTHAQIAVYAAEHGVNVLVEKPMATSSPECRKMVQTAEKAGVKLCVVKNHRYIPAVRRLKEIVEKGEIGRLLVIRGWISCQPPLAWTKANWPFEKDKGGGVLFNVACHVIDLMLWLAESPVVEVYGVGGDRLGYMNVENDVEAVMLFENGCVGFLEASWLCGALGHVIEVKGTGGLAVVDARSNHMFFYTGHLTPVEELGNTVKKLFRVAKDCLTGRYFKGYLEYHKQLMEDYAKAILNDEKPPVTGEEGLKVVATMEAIREALETGRLVKPVLPP